MTIYEIFMEGRKAHSNGAYYSYGGDYPVGSHEETAWRAGWEIGCAEEIAQGREGRGAWPKYPLLNLID